MLYSILNYIWPTPSARSDTDTDHTNIAEARPARTTSPAPLTSPFNKRNNRQPNLTDPSNLRWSIAAAESETNTDTLASDRLGNSTITIMNFSEKSVEFVEKIVSAHLKNFCDAIQKFDTDGNDDPLIIAAAARLRTSVKLLKGVKKSPQDDQLFETVKKVSNACDCLAKTLPVHDKKRFINATHAPFTEAMADWCRQNVDAIESLHKIRDDENLTFNLPPQFVPKITDVSNLGLWRLCSVLAGHLVGLSSAIKLQQQVIASDVAGWKPKLGNKLSATVLQTAIAEQKNIRAATINLGKSIVDSVDVVKLVKKKFIYRSANAEITALLKRVATTQSDLALLGRAIAIFTAECGQLLLTATAGKAMNEPVAAEFFKMIDKVEHVRANAEYKFNASEVAFITAEQNKPALCVLMERLSEQLYTVEVDFRRLLFQLEASPPTRFTQRSDLINLLYNTAESCGELRAANCNVMMTYLAESHSITAEQLQRANELKEKYFKPFEEENSQSHIAVDTKSDVFVEVKKHDTSTSIKASGEAKRRRRKEASEKKSLSEISYGVDNSRALLERAQLVIIKAISEEAQRADVLYSETLKYAERQLTNTRNEVAQPGKFPHSVAKVKKHVFHAGDCLDRGASSIEERLQILRDAKQDIEIHVPASDVNIEQQQEVLALEKKWQVLATQLRSRSDEFNIQADFLGGAQRVNCFLAYPTYEHYRKLVADQNIHITAEKTCEKKRLSPVTVLGFEKPTPDYLDIYRIKVSAPQIATHLDESISPAEWVELHLHFDSDDRNASPVCGHLKTQEQATLSGPEIYRGIIPNAELLAVTGDVCRYVEKA